MIPYDVLPDGIYMPQDVIFRGERAHIPQRYRNAHLHESHRGVAADLARKFVLEFLDPDADKYSMLLAGPTGGGKTHLACAVLNELNRLLHTTGSFDCFFFNLNRDLPALVDKRSQGDYDYAVRLMQRLETTDLLVVDDLLHVARQSWIQDLVYRIYEARYANELRTITTLNAEIKNEDEGPDWSPIKETYNEAFMRRVVEPAGHFIVLM